MGLFSSVSKTCRNKFWRDRFGIVGADGVYIYSKFKFKYGGHYLHIHLTEYDDDTIKISVGFCIDPYSGWEFTDDYRLGGRLQSGSFLKYYLVKPAGLDALFKDGLIFFKGIEDFFSDPRDVQFLEYLVRSK